MLFVLTDELADVAPTPGVLDAVESLLLATREGKHAVVGSRPVVRWLQGLRPDSPAVRAIADRVTELRAYQDAVSVRVDVVAPGKPAAGDGVVFRLPLDRLDDSSSVQATVVLVESEYDLPLFGRLGAAWGMRQRRALRSESRLRIGGGSNFAAQLELAVEAGELVFGVVDSDRDNAGGALGATASRARAVLATRPGAPAAVEVLPARDIENLLPDRLIEEAAAAAGDRSTEWWALFERWRAAGLIFPKHNDRYVDVKEGLEDLPGLGENLLRQVAAFVQTLSVGKLGEHLFADDDGTWDDLGATAFSWTCATRRVRST